MKIRQVIVAGRSLGILVDRLRADLPLVIHADRGDAGVALSRTLARPSTVSTGHGDVPTLI